MASTNQVPTPPPDAGSYSRVSPAQAAADAIPILVDDTYHLFHLATPPYTRHHPPRLRSSWWRLRSKNLVDWTRDAEPSIKPGSNKDDPDADGAWTGAAVSGPDGNMNIFYTGYNLSRGGKQVILRAEGTDRHGTAFDSPAREISFTGEGRSRLEDIDFRDPYVFYNDAESRYWMIIASRLVGGPHWSRGCVALLTSTDLETWTFEPEPLYSPNDMFCPECPELFSMPNGKWYLVYSRFHAPNSGTVYRVADSPYGPFRVPRDGSHGRLDGRRWYAAKSCPRVDDSNKRVYFGWTGDYVDEEGKWLWGGDMALPREVSADEQGHLRIDVVPEVKQLCQDTSSRVSPQVLPETLSLSAMGDTRLSFADLGVAESQDLFVSFAIRKCDAHSFGVILQADGDSKGHRMQITPGIGGTSTVSLLTDFPPLDDFWADQYGLHLARPVDGPEIVRHEAVRLDDGMCIFYRGQLLEIFCGGRSISFRLPLPVLSPNGGDAADANAALPRRLGLFVEDGQVELSNITLKYGGQATKVTS